MPALFILRYKKLFLLQKPLNTCVNSKYQSKGSTYILHLLSFVEIALFNVFFWERKAGCRKLMKNVRDAGFSWKTSGNAGAGHPLPDPESWLTAWKYSMTFAKYFATSFWITLNRPDLACLTNRLHSFCFESQLLCIVNSL